MDENTQRLQKSVMLVLLVGVAIVVGIFIFYTMAETMGVETQSLSIVNETLTAVEETGDNLANFNLRDASCTVSVCINETDSIVIPSANYTTTNCLVAFSGAEDDQGFNNSNWECSYGVTFTNYTTTGETGNEMIDALGTGSAWLAIILVTVFAIVILRMLSAGVSKTSEANVAQY